MKLPLQFFIFFLAAGLIAGSMPVRAQDADALSYWDTNRHGWAVMPGTCKLMVGAPSRDIGLQGQSIVN